MRGAAAWLVVLSAGLAWGQGAPADQHMLSGAQHFRDERYPEALVEFRAAERSAGGDPGAAWYVAASLVKLRRSEEALIEFARAEAQAPKERDALFDYYRALACYQAKLYLCADRLLAAVGAGAGPRIAAQAQQVRADLVAVTTQTPPTEAIDWYHVQGQAALKAQRPPLALAYFDEAAGLAALRADGHRRGEAQTGAAQARRMMAAPAAAGRRP
jgi:tetratricopeptide (TPR) repeat protein